MRFPGTAFVTTSGVATLPWAGMGVPSPLSYQVATFTLLLVSPHTVSLDLSNMLQEPSATSWSVE